MSKKDDKIKELKNEIKELKESLETANKRSESWLSAYEESKDLLSNTLDNIFGITPFVKRWDAVEIPEDNPLRDTLWDIWNSMRDKRDAYLAYSNPNVLRLQLPDELAEKGYMAFRGMGDQESWVVDSDFNVVFSWSQGDGYPCFQFCAGPDKSLHDYGSQLGYDTLFDEDAIEIFVKKYEKNPDVFDNYASISEKQSSVAYEALRILEDLQDKQDSGLANVAKDAGKQVEQVNAGRGVEGNEAPENNNRKDER